MEGGPCEDMGRRWAPTAKESGLRRDHPCPQLIPGCNLQDREHSVCCLSTQAGVLCQVAEMKEGVSFNLGSGVRW